MKRQHKAASREGSQVDANNTFVDSSDLNSSNLLTRRPRRSLRKKIQTVRNGEKKQTRSSICSDAKTKKNDENYCYTSDSQSDEVKSKKFALSKLQNRQNRAQTCPPRKLKTNLNSTAEKVIKLNNSDSDDDAFRCPRCKMYFAFITEFKIHISKCFQSQPFVESESQFLTCPTCPYRTKNSSIHSHVRHCSGKFKDEFIVNSFGQLQCLFCKRVFSLLHNLFRHLECQACKKSPAKSKARINDVKRQSIGSVLQNRSIENVELCLDSVTPMMKGNRRSKKVTIFGFPEDSSLETGGSEVAEMTQQKKLKSTIISEVVKEVDAHKKDTNAGEVESTVERSKTKKGRKTLRADAGWLLTSRSDTVEHEVNTGATLMASDSFNYDIGSNVKKPKSKQSSKKRRSVESDDRLNSDSSISTPKSFSNQPSTSTISPSKPPTEVVSSVEPVIQHQSPKTNQKKKRITGNDDNSVSSMPSLSQYHLNNSAMSFDTDFFQFLLVSPQTTVISTKKNARTPITRDAKNRPLHECPKCEYQSCNTANLRRHIRLIHGTKRLSWLGVVDKQGKPIPEGEVAATAIDKTTIMSSSNERLSSTVYYSCKYCDYQVTRFGYLSHMTLLHLDVRGAAFPNIYTLQPNAVLIPYARMPPESDDWPIDFSRILQNDLGLQISRKTYDTMFHMASNADPSQYLDAEFDRFFAYTITTPLSHASLDTYYHYTCPSCSENFKTLTLPMLQIAVITHIGLHHRKSRCLMFLVEQELSLFNSSFNTSFEVCVSIGPGPLLANEFVLNDDKFFMAQYYGITNCENDSKGYVCRQCLLLFPRLCDFLPHLDKVHGITKRHRWTLVEPWKILNRRDAQQRLNNMEPFAFSIDRDGNWSWVCYNCNHFINASTPLEFFILAGVHLLSKVQTIEWYARVCTWISIFFDGPIPKLSNAHYYEQQYAYLITNCRDLKAQSSALPPSSSPISRFIYNCYFCGVSIGCSSDIAENVAIVYHIIRDHNDIMNNASILSFMASSGIESIFPFLDPVYEDNLVKEKENRRLRCSICQCVFQSFKQLKIHAMLHLDTSFNLDPKQYMFSMTIERCRKLCLEIHGIGPDFKPISLSLDAPDLYACLQCGTVFDDSPTLKFRMYEHIRQCPFPSTYAVPEVRIAPSSKPSKKDNFLPLHACPTCSKHYLREHAITCCTSGTIRSTTKKDEIAEESIPPKIISHAEVSQRVFDT